MGSIVIYGLTQFTKNNTIEDYFIANRNTPWWVAMLSIVATETSVLTFISVPGFAYRNDWFFLQLVLGYILGRIMVAYILLPMYFSGNIISIYEVIGNRFGFLMQKLSSAVFLITRLLADGVRFFATAVVVQVITGWDIGLSILIIGLITSIYTLCGGIRTIMWIDSLQFVLYLAGGIFIIIFILNTNNYVDIEKLFNSKKIQVFNLSTDNMFFDPWYFISAIFGGTILSFSSHGIDYMMVQRVLSCNNLNTARRAMVGSGIFIFIQFVIFTIIGSLIWLHMHGIELEKDRELSTFIVNHLPVGIRGILLAGVLSAAMSTLSSSINSLASSTLNDWFKSRPTFKVSFLISLFWSVLLILIAFIFDYSESSVIVVGLKIASYTYGGLLALFILSMFNREFKVSILIIGFIFSLLIVYYFQWIGLAWTWYIGAATLLNITIVFGLSFFKRFSFASCILLIIFFVFNKFNHGSYRSGFDVIALDNYSLIRNKNIGLVVNHTSLDINGEHIVDNMFSAGLNIKAIFSPEHGFEGTFNAGEKVNNKIENLMGIPIYSLYGDNKKPTNKMLEGIDILVFDIQDIGIRYYTYLSTLTNVLEAAAENQIEVIVLDRLNPLGRNIAGPILDGKYKSFVGMHPIPIRHGMTFGELAHMINRKGWLNEEMKADLTVIKYKGKIKQDDINNAFVPAPSPNMSNFETAWLYQGLCLLEGTNLSEGRGTNIPFKLIGAPWLDAHKLFIELNKNKSDGDKFSIIQFTPKSIPASKFPKYNNNECYGLKIFHLENPIEWIIKTFRIINNIHPDEFKFLDTNFIDKLFGNNSLKVIINDKLSIEDLLLKIKQDEKEFIDIRNPYLLY